MKRRHLPSRRGFSLIEAAIIVMMVAIAVPPATSMLINAASERSDRVVLSVATTYGASLVERICADVSANGLDILADDNAYLSTPFTGLWARTAWLAEPCTARGIGAEVEISDLVAIDGQVSSNADENLYRLVTVTVRAPTGTGETLSIPMSVMVGEPNP